ncbi:hypothetical protein [Bosea sp. 117]|uniref:hypothetical protein n=1 Tax=Bosea sp. 117 TaxID=1125973 RepID=UPI000494418E|nr:hypothetical protein [Bosea sp. 117]
MRPSIALLAALAAAPVCGVAAPAFAETLTADAAKAFVVGRTFAYRCYEGSVGSGRILADGSVAGTIRLRGKGSPRYVTLPAGTLQVKGASVCAQMKGMAFQPCFEVEKTTEVSFRGNLAGFDRMWCEFTRDGAGRTRLASRRTQGDAARAEPARAKTAQIEAAGD